MKAKQKIKTIKLPENLRKDSKRREGGEVDLRFPPDLTLDRIPFLIRQSSGQHCGAIQHPEFELPLILCTSETELAFFSHNKSRKKFEILFKIKMPKDRLPHYGLPIYVTFLPFVENRLKKISFKPSEKTLSTRIDKFRQELERELSSGCNHYFRLKNSRRLLKITSKVTRSHDYTKNCKYPVITGVPGNRVIFNLFRYDSSLYKKYTQLRSSGINLGQLYSFKISYSSSEASTRTSSKSEYVYVVVSSNYFCYVLLINFSNKKVLKKVLLSSQELSSLIDSQPLIQYHQHKISKSYETPQGESYYRKFIGTMAGFSYYLPDSDRLIWIHNRNYNTFQGCFDNCLIRKEQVKISIMNSYGDEDILESDVFGNEKRGSIGLVKRIGDREAIVVDDEFINVFNIFDQRVKSTTRFAWFRGKRQDPLHFGISHPSTNYLAFIANLNIVVLEVPKRSKSSTEKDSGMLKSILDVKWTTKTDSGFSGNVYNRWEDHFGFQRKVLGFRVDERHKTIHIAFFERGGWGNLWLILVRIKGSPEQDEWILDDDSQGLIKVMISQKLKLRTSTVNYIGKGGIEWLVSDPKGFHSVIDPDYNRDSIVLSGSSQYLCSHSSSNEHFLIFSSASNRMVINVYKITQILPNLKEEDEIRYSPSISLSLDRSVNLAKLIGIPPTKMKYWYLTGREGFVIALETSGSELEVLKITSDGNGISAWNKFKINEDNNTRMLRFLNILRIGDGEFLIFIKKHKPKIYIWQQKKQKDAVDDSIQEIIKQMVRPSLFKLLKFYSKNNKNMKICEQVTLTGEISMEYPQKFVI